RRRPRHIQGGNPKRDPPGGAGWPDAAGQTRRNPQTAMTVRVGSTISRCRARQRAGSAERTEKDERQVHTKPPSRGRWFEQPSLNGRSPKPELLSYLATALNSERGLGGFVRDRFAVVSTSDVNAAVARSGGTARP